MNWWTWWLVWDFPAGTVCKEISYSLFLPQRSGSLYRSRLGSRDPIVSPPRVCGLTPPVLCCSVFHFKKSHPMVECVRESVRHVLTSTCLHISIWMCVFQGCWGFFFHTGSTVVHMCAFETVWGLVVSCPPPPDSFLSPSSSRSSYYIPSLPFPTAALVSLYHHPSFVYSVEDVWLNILRPDESSRFSNFSCPARQRKTKACAKYIWMRSVNLFERTFYFSSFPVSITLHLPSPPSIFFSLVCFFGPYFRICKGIVMKYGILFLFQRLASAKAHTSRFVSANLPCNKFKNRLVNIMPYETTRVCLQPIRGVEGSDYINASFIDGYRSEKIWSELVFSLSFAGIYVTV